MLTKEQIKNYIKPRLFKRYVAKYRDDPAWAWQLVKTAVQNANPGQKTEIVKALQSVSIVRTEIDTLAEQEAETMLANNSLDIDELSRILPRA